MVTKNKRQPPSQPGSKPQLKKKAEAIIIGFEEEVIDPFANRPVLGARRTDSTKPKGLNQS